MPETQLASMFIGSADDGDDIDRGRPSKVGNMIHILDGQTDEVLGHINKKYVIENEHERDLPSHKDYFRFTVLADNKHAEHLTKRNGLIIPGEDGEFLEFRIFESIKYRNNEGFFIEVHALATYLDLRNQKIFDPHKTNPETALQHATIALAGTEWQVGEIDFKGTRTLTFDNPFNSYDYILRIAREFELEPRFYIKTDGNKITGRYVDLIEQIGEFRGRTIEFGRDLQSIERKEDTSEVVTALWVYGPEKEDGTRLKVFVEDDEARQRWGRRGQHIIDYYEPQTENQDITEERLRTLGEMELRKRINAVVTYEAEILDLENVPGLENKKIRFGDTIRIKDTKFNPPLYVEARVFNVKRDVFNKANKTVQLGDYREYTEDEVKAIWNQLRQQIQNKISQAQLEDYAEPKKIESDTPPAIKQGVNPIWIDTSKDPHVPHIVEQGQWVKISPTEANEVGAETPQGAQEKAEQAEQSAKEHADTVANQAKQEAISYSENFTINYAQKQITSSTTPPTNPEIGDLWFDNSTQPPTFRRWNGSEWEKLSATTFEELEGMIDKSQLPDRVIDSMKLAIDAVQEENLAENSVYAEAIQAEAVGAQAIAANAILAKHIAAGEVTANHLAADAVTADAIAAGAILAEHISANSITANHIKSLVGLNVNDQFIVDSQGNVKFSGSLEGATGTFSGVVEGGSIKSNTIIDVTTDLNVGKRIYLQPDYYGYTRNGIFFDRYNVDLHITAGYDIDFTPTVSISAIQDTSTGFELGNIFLYGKTEIFGNATVQNDLRVEFGSLIVGDGIHSNSNITAGTTSGYINLRPGNNHGFIEFYRTAGRAAYIGVPSAGSEYFDINADGLSGEIRLRGRNVLIEQRLISPQTYNVTVQNPANVFVTSTGYFARSTSSKRYKADIQYNDIDYKKILKLQQASWVDRKEFENNDMSAEGLKRYYGAIAEDFEKIGLSEFVVYNEETGEVENFSDRAWVLLIPNINDILNELKQIKERLERLENEGNSV